MTGLKFMNRFGLPLKQDLNASHSATPFGAASFFIESNAGRKRITNSRGRAALKLKRIRRCNFICADSSRSSCSWRSGPSSKSEHVLRRTEYPAAIRDLIAQLRQMPGVGPRSAERIALWMVRARNDQPEQIARAIADTRQSIHSCSLCGFFAASDICEICADSSRSSELLCVVEQPTDILPLEKTGAFRGRY